MARDDAQAQQQLTAAKRAYNEAKAVGNCQEEARWANLIGDILKNRGEYVKALKWLRIDYDISVQHLPQKQLLPTCQSLGEVYLRLQHYKEALTYQKRHLELAKDSNDLVEQQRAYTQLGRTYHEMSLKSDDDHYALRNAKKYFKSSMELARTLKESGKSYFLKEYIDAHNNLGLLEKDLDNFEEARKILHKALKICDEEEVIEDDDARSRINHNLGSVYLELGMWAKARVHIDRDIRICERIGHRQGEAKGYINLGELHYRGQNYEDALGCYKKALKIAESMEDEDALVENINENINTIEKAAIVLDELKKEEQNLKKLIRNTAISRGTEHERMHLLQQNVSLDRLIEKSNTILAWLKHLEFAKRKKKVASELCDKEKISDSLLAIGESYKELQNFDKALKWYEKSWNICKSINNLEGQALAKINIGQVLDSDGDWTGALAAFEEGYRIAREANLPSAQISALESMHYSHMIRFDNVDEARRLKHKIQDLKCSRSADLEVQNRVREFCSETDTDGEGNLSDNRSNTCNSPNISDSPNTRSKQRSSFEQIEDDEPLISLMRSSKTFSKSKSSQTESPSKFNEPRDKNPQCCSRSSETQYPLVSRKRVRVVLSDDESDGHAEEDISRGRIRSGPLEDVATSSEFRKSDGSVGFSSEFLNVSHVAPRDTFPACTPINLEESTCSHKSESPKIATASGAYIISLNVKDSDNMSKLAGCGSKTDGDRVSDNLLQNRNDTSYNPHITDEEYSHFITFKIDGKMIDIDMRSSTSNDKLSIESMKVEVACCYYLQLSEEMRSKGLFPIIQHIKSDDKVLESVEAVDNLKDFTGGKILIEVAIHGWVQKRFMKSYINCCKKVHEAPSMKLLKKLYNLEVSEDEVIVSDCDLQDISIAPLLDALGEHKTIAMLDLSHNMLGNETMEKLQQIFLSSRQKYGGLTLDLHSNRFGPTALFQICECPVLFTRLEVLNISGNRLTDACGSYLSTIIENCKALYNLNIERCAITSRAIQKVADAINSGSMLAQLWIGHNNPVTGNAMTNLLAKLATLKSFTELNVNGIKLSKPAVDKLCQLARTSCLSGLMLGNTNIDSDGLLELTKVLSTGPQELVKLDLSYCGLMPHPSEKLCVNLSLIGGILELNLAGNSIGQEGANALASLLMNSQCCLKVLTLKKCHLKLAGVTRIIQALADNVTLEELNLAENADSNKQIVSKHDTTPEMSSKSLEPNLSTEFTRVKCASNELQVSQEEVCVVNSEPNHLEVADSEEGPMNMDTKLSGLEDTCSSLFRRNMAFSESLLIEELSTAIFMAKNLQLLDLSKNGFTSDIVEALYTAWSSDMRSAGSAQRHIKEGIVHFSVDGKNCCGVKVCCRRYT